MVPERDRRHWSTDRGRSRWCFDGVRHMGCGWVVSFLTWSMTAWSIKARKLYVCMSCINIIEVVLMHLDPCGGLGRSLSGCEFLGMVPTYISITKKYMQNDWGAPDSNR